MSLIALFKSRGANGFGYASTAEEVTHGLDLTGKTYLVTGCNSGLGQETQRVLQLRGAHVLGAARTAAKARQAGASTPLACELADPVSVRACVAAVQQLGRRLDGIICNAGIMALPTLQQAGGCELQFYTNHMGHFILVTGLLDMLTHTGRIVLLSSKLHERAPASGIDFDNLSGDKGYDPWAAYGQSKMANVLFAKELSRRLAGTGQTANAVAPGVIATNLLRHSSKLMAAAFNILGPLVLKTIPQGAATSTYVATHPHLAHVSGAYFADCNVGKPRADAEDASLAQSLWEVSEKLAAAR